MLARLITRWRARRARLENRIEDIEIALGSIQGELAEVRRMYHILLEAITTDAVNKAAARVRYSRVLDDIIEQEIS